MKWNFHHPSGPVTSSSSVIVSSSSSVNKSTSLVVKGEIPAPLGYDVAYVPGGADDSSINMTAEMQQAAKQRQVMNIAYSPGKNLLTTAFMLWMSGSSIQIFSIMMTGMSLINPLKALFAVNEPFRAFEKEEGLDLKMPKMIFAGLQILALGVALYKCSTMGLLPLTSADWASYLPKVVYREMSINNFSGVDKIFFS